jgi:hypothetical protein
MSSKIITAVTSLDWKDIAVRALWTFVQAFLATVLFVAEDLIDLIFLGDWTATYGLIIATSIAGLAAGLSAVKTVVVQVVRDIKAKAE